MTLKNLLGISLDAVEAEKGQVAKLLTAAQRNIADAQLPGPFVYVGKLVRFNLDEVTAWARRCASEVDDQGLDALQNFETGSGSRIQTNAKLPA